MEILHKKGKYNTMANSLSRKDEEIQVFVVSLIVPKWLDEIRMEYAKNQEVSSIINNLS